MIRYNISRPVHDPNDKQVQCRIETIIGRQQRVLFSQTSNSGQPAYVVEPEDKSSSLFPPQNAST